jgi:hypothetical protein
MEQPWNEVDFKVPFGYDGTLKLCIMFKVSTFVRPY